MKNIILNISSALLSMAAFSFGAAAQEYGNVVAKKTATNNYDGTYTLTMETYATGNHVLTTTKTPVDAVLVLDLSNSMTENKITGTNYVLSKDSKTPVYTLKTLLAADVDPKNYYIYWSDGKYYQLSGTKKSFATFTVDGETYGIKADGTVYSTCSEVPEAFQTVALHTTQNGITRLQELQEGCAIFVSNLKVDQQQWNEDNTSDKQVTHRISIVTYNESAETVLTFDAGDVVSNYSSILTTIMSFTTKDMSYADKGMELAEKVIDGARKEASKLVVFFTDGYPNSGTAGESDDPNDQGAFSSVAASRAIGYSKEIKDAGASVYSLTVISQTAGDKVDNFMNYISSNYPEATSLSTPGATTSSDFYSIATDQEAFTAVFDKISKSISGGSEPELDASSYLLDIVSEYFMLPAGAENASVEAYTNDLRSIDAAGDCIFDTAASTAGLSTSIDGKQIKVTGFNYTDNFCGTHITIDASGSPLSEIHGKRLVVKATIIPDPDTDTGYCPTNDESSGIYTSDGDVVKKFVTEPESVYSQADLTIKVSGLKEGESAIFTVTSDVDVKSYGSTTATKFVRTVVLTGPDASTVVKAPVTYGDDQFVKYTVMPTSWAKAYSITPDSIEKELFKESGSGRILDNVFEFKADRTEDNKLPLNDENLKENKFGWHTDSGSGD